MAEVKRLNYFNSQFLKEKDFQDEQAYHIQMRRLNNQRLHTPGIVSGLEVAQVGNTEISVTAGMAIDRDGREIFLPPDPPPSNFNLSSFTGNAMVYLTIAYGEVFDPVDLNPGGGDQYVRTTERSTREVKADTPPTDGSVIVLAKVTLFNGQITSDSIDLTVRSSFVSSTIAPNSITLDKLAPNLQPIVSIGGVNSPGGDIELIAINAITIDSNDPNNQITIGESHSTRTDNPHGITATQIGAIPDTGGTTTGNLILKGIADDAGDLIFMDSADRQKGRIWTNPTTGDSGMYLSSGDNTPDIAIDKDGKVGIGTATPGAKLQVSGGQTILEQEPWKDAPLVNGWANYGEGFNSSGYFKDSLGIVHLKGLVKLGGGTIFTLPEGYRPAARELHCVQSNGIAGRVDILPNGEVQLVIGSNIWVSLDGITFREGSFIPKRSRFERFEKDFFTGAVRPLGGIDFTEFAGR